jgi:hypothetical protein
MWQIRNVGQEEYGREEPCGTNGTKAGRINREGSQVARMKKE